MEENKLTKYLLPYCVSERTQIQYEEPLTYKYSIVDLRETLINIGFIILEDIKNSIYVIKIKSGLLNLTYAYFVLELKDNNLNIAGCANEGALSQNIYDKAIRKLMEGISDENKTAK